MEFDFQVIDFMCVEKSESANYPSPLKTVQKKQEMFLNGGNCRWVKKIVIHGDDFQVIDFMCVKKVWERKLPPTPENGSKKTRDVSEWKKLVDE